MHAYTNPGSALTYRAVPPAVRTERPADCADRRMDSRNAAVFTIGKLTFRGKSQPCMVRNLSAGGMRVQTNNPPGKEESVLIEMRGLSPRIAKAVWTSGNEAGLAFIERCDPAEVFAVRISRNGHVARQPRFTLRRAVELLIDGAALPAEIADISVGGARLILPEALLIGTPGVLRLALPNRDGIAGELCWSNGGDCGFRFVQPISSVLLALALESVSPD